MIDICPICQIATPCDCDDHEETNVGKLMHAGAKLAMRIGQLEAQNHQLREALRDIAEDQEGDYDFIVWQARAALGEDK